jgi:hypothetical protein
MRLALVVLVAVAALLAAGGAAARDPKQPQQRHTAADTTLARSVALRLKDLGGGGRGWRVAPDSKPAPPCSSSPDESKLVQTARVDPTFVWSDGVTTVGSEVDVFRSAGEARTDWRFSTLGLMRACLLETLQKAVGKTGKVRVTAARALPKPGLGERSLHYRLVFVLNGNAARALVAELVAFNVGRTSVVLHTLSLGRPLPQTAVEGLSGVLAKRLADAAGAI